MNKGGAAMMAPIIAWGRIAASLAQLGLAANEVIWRRTLMTALGSLSIAEAQRMIAEKPATVARSMARAMTATARGGNPAAVTAAALRPFQNSTASNARRLRR
jgi:hypothetical protein